ncbi:hypothetical protein AB0I49_26805 [Streptomyces sp. NPDC050617]|uniref:hypothetical protein n=1 Tax=Streptomyces sp. NPDC050617 TaxID=3154628 RepID=UPI00341CA0C6
MSEMSDAVDALVASRSPVPATFTDAPAPAGEMSEVPDALIGETVESECSSTPVISLPAKGLACDQLRMDITRRKPSTTTPAALAATTPGGGSRRPAAKGLHRGIRSAPGLTSTSTSSAAFRVRTDGTELDQLDVMIDFVPVVHLANTIPPAGEHWVRSALARVLQGLDESVSDLRL